MRPQKFTPLFASVRNLDGVGPRLATLLKKLLPPNAASESADPRIVDLLWHAPTGLIDRSHQPTIREAVAGTIVTMTVRVVKHSPPPNRSSKAPYRVRCEDDSGTIDLIFFRADPRYVARQLPVGESRIISGRVESYGERLQMPHPDFIVADKDRASLPLLEPVYPLTAGLSGKILIKAMTQAMSRLPDMAEWQEPRWLEARKWPDIRSAIEHLHHPKTALDAAISGPNWQRLAFDELLANQLALAIVRARGHDMPGCSIVGDNSIRAKLADNLPFSLTKSQVEVIAEIEADLAAPSRMLRLLQGDVGSGKTVVALMAMAIAVEAKAQACLMAPTEVLARQHYETITPLANAAGITIGLLTGREKGRPRKQILTMLEDGSLDILIGTHAIFQADVDFNNLALAVIDEQHRFGVHQRLALQGKGGGGNKNGGADVLVMTATPIPRTLQMTHYGDLDVSYLREKPAGRKPIKTVTVSNERLEEILQRLKRAFADGAQAYWVCPLVEGSDKLDLAAAEERHAHLMQYFGERVGLVHGQMSGKAKDAAMQAFADGETWILVATTVIEVGVDVANASIMVVEHAERFGLAQLHQLRGRVGRGERQSSCILLYQSPLGEASRARLETMRRTEDGFVIAEEDLRLRGAGEVLGTRQSGLPEFRIAQVPNFEELLLAARDDARLILSRDPGLKSERGQALRDLLYLFDCDEAIRLFRVA